MPEDTRRKLVVIEEGTLTGMAVNEAFLAEFPFLASVASFKPKGCGGCGGAAKARASVFSAAKAALAGMASEKKRKLKDMLNAHQVRITYRNAANKIIALTF